MKSNLKHKQIDPSVKITTEEVDKDQLIEVLTEGAEMLLPIIDQLPLKSARRILSILVFAPILQHPTKKPRSEAEAAILINYLRLQDIKIALAELLDQEGISKDEQETDND